MKVIKRDGRVVEYDKDKIELAIEKANKEVLDEEKITKIEIQDITKYIEKLNKKRMLVEDIQDIIEEKLMEKDKYQLAKKYIVYRYTRTLVRKANTTDESILGIIRNENKELSEKKSENNILSISKQRNHIAGEVSRDLTKRLLLPEKIVKAHQEGILYFHNADYFVHPSINSCIVNISDMLDNNTVINDILIETPQTFQTACIIVSQIIITIASNQYGKQYIDLIHLGKYLRKSYEKLEKEVTDEFGGTLSKQIIEKFIQKKLKIELNQGIQTILYQINSLIDKPNVTFLLHVKKDDQYIEENVMIIKEILEQKSKKIENTLNILVAPELEYLPNGFDELRNSEYEYLIKLIEIYDNEKQACKAFEGNYKEGTFNQGVVSINLLQTAQNAGGEEDLFWKLLENYLELCFEALMCRHYALLGTISDSSPIHWQSGAIARLEKGEKINQLLYDGTSTMSLGYFGMDDTINCMSSIFKSEQETQKFSSKLFKFLKNTINKWKKISNIDFVLCDTSSYFK